MEAPPALYCHRQPISLSRDTPQFHKKHCSVNTSPSFHTLNFASIPARKAGRSCTTGLSKFWYLLEAPQETKKSTDLVCNIIIGYIDDAWQRQCRSKLEPAQSVQNIQDIIQDELDILRPTPKKHKLFFSSKHPRGLHTRQFLNEMRKAKFLKVINIMFFFWKQNKFDYLQKMIYPNMC